MVVPPTGPVLGPWSTFAEGLLRSLQRLGNLRDARTGLEAGRLAAEDSDLPTILAACGATTA
jgi:hypothetical protein